MLIVLKDKTEKKKKLLVDPQKSVFLSFKTKTAKKCSSYFSNVLALKTIDAQMFCWSVFWKAH